MGLLQSRAHLIGIMQLRVHLIGIVAVEGEAEAGEGVVVAKLHNVAANVAGDDRAVGVGEGERLRPLGHKRQALLPPQ